MRPQTFSAAGVACTTTGGGADLVVKQIANGAMKNSRKIMLARHEHS